MCYALGFRFRILIAVKSPQRSCRCWWSSFFFAIQALLVRTLFYVLARFPYPEKVAAIYSCQRNIYGHSLCALLFLQLQLQLVTNLHGADVVLVDRCGVAGLKNLYWYIQIHIGRRAYSILLVRGVENLLTGSVPYLKRLLQFLW